MSNKSFHDLSKRRKRDYLNSIRTRNDVLPQNNNDNEVDNIPLNQRINDSIIENGNNLNEDETNLDGVLEFQNIVDVRPMNCVRQQNILENSTPNQLINPRVNDIVAENGLAAVNEEHYDVDNENLYPDDVHEQREEVMMPNRKIHTSNVVWNEVEEEGEEEEEQIFAEEDDEEENLRDTNNLNYDLPLYNEAPLTITQNGSAVTSIKGVYEDSIAAASEVHSADYNDSDDSDMYLEPDGAETMNQESKQATKLPATLSIDEESLSAVTTVADPKTEAHKVEIGPTAQEDKSLEQESQNFFPSFAELFANHRLTYNEQQQQQRYRPNRFLGYFQRDRNNAYQTSASMSKDTQHPLLGSGNFGVIRGGTYYPEEKENDEYNVDESLYNPYYSSSSAARGRSTNYYRNPKPQPVRAGDFFSNFRDFADITAPPKSSFSHLSVVYANRNDTKSSRAEGTTEPRNIIETLKMLEEDNIEDDLITTTEAPMKKLSQGKRKLLKMKKYHESKDRKFRMTVEPLLALS